MLMVNSTQKIVGQVAKGSFTGRCYTLDHSINTALVGLSVSKLVPNERAALVDGENGLSYPGVVDQIESDNFVSFL
jgi:hypothetical protein